MVMMYPMDISQKHMGFEGSHWIFFLKINYLFSLSYGGNEVLLFEKSSGYLIVEYLVRVGWDEEGDIVRLLLWLVLLIEVVEVGKISREQILWECHLINK